MNQHGVDPDWLVPEWAVEGVGALMTTRRGGASAAPFEAMNLSPRVGDAAASVKANRACLAKAIAARPVYLQQVHGAEVQCLESANLEAGSFEPEADASVTTQAGLACTVLVADCLPVLFAAPHGRAVGAAHAGWRGLASGVLEATLAEVSRAGACTRAQVTCWLGACIGPRHFEVGIDVLRAFGVMDGHPLSPESSGFAPRGNGKWLADLPWLARARLTAAGAVAIHGGHWCTFDEPQRFFSYRRDRITGRMAAAIWIET